ncbi:MAG TPA: phospholipase D-like domain-containing protein [Bacteroidia bacterium]|nr:phospholipase D-like domain-containing protein [Bacteroidia bacterium]
MSRSEKIFSPKSYTGGNTAELIRGGKDFFRKLIEVIDAAQSTIHFQNYILDDDETGRSVCDALKRAAQRGVKVFLMLDAWGSRSLSEEFISSLVESGIVFRWFGKMITKRGFHIGRRMHHKIVVCDSQFSLVGGMNIANRYHGNDGNPPWLDFAVYSEGNISVLLEHVCQKFWKRNPLKKRLHFAKKKIDAQQEREKDSVLMRVRENDWVMRRFQVMASYRKAVIASKESLTIFGAYFLPGFRFLYRLRKAAARGVKIRIVVPAKSDSEIGNTARHYIYSFLLRNNIELYEYTRTMLHAKVCVADGVWSAIGSYDLNNLSAYSNVEANVEIFDRGFAVNLKNEMDVVIKNDCEQITLESYGKKLTLINRFRYWMAYHTIRLLFRISILLASKTEE